MPPGALGRIQGSVGIPHQGLTVGAIPGVKGDTHGETDIDLVTIEVEGVGVEGEQALAEADQIREALVSIRRREDQHEFIAPQTAQGVFRPQVPGQALPHVPEQLVAQGVATAVVDVLEVIQVEVEYRQMALVALGLGDLLRQAVQPQQAVGQASERIIVGQVFHHALRPPALGDIPHDTEHGRAAVVEDLARPGLDHQGAALGVPVVGFKGNLAIAVHRREAGRGMDRVLGGIDGGDVQVQELLARVAVLPTGMLVHREDVPLQIQDEDGIDDAIEDGAIARFTVAQGRLGGADLGGARLGLPYQLSAEFAAALLVGSRFPLAWLEDGAVLHTDRGAVVVGLHVRHLPPDQLPAGPEGFFAGPGAPIHLHDSATSLHSILHDQQYRPPN